MEKNLVVCIIRNKKGELLLQKKTMDCPNFPGKWCLFGGNVESVDLDKEMNRELREEIGFKLNLKFIFTKKIIINKQKLIFSVFIAELNDSSKIKLGEGAGFAFFDKKELKNLNINEETKPILKEYFKR